MCSTVIRAAVLVGILLVQLPAIAGAQNAPTNAVRHEFAGGLSLAHFDFKEFDSQGNRLLREDGFLPGLAGRWDGRFRRWAFGLAGDLSGGEVDYDGRTQAGTPVQTKTDELIYETRARIGWIVPLKSGFSSEFFGALGYRGWERDIQSTPISGSVSETYRWVYGSAGFKGGYRPRPASAWHLHLEILRPLDPEVEVRIGGFDDVTLDLGEETGWRLAVINRRTLDPKKHLEFGLEYTAWDLGRSSPKPLTRNGMATGFVVSEPASETRVIALRANFIYTLN
jgi:hypothetical protein